MKKSLVVLASLAMLSISTAAGAAPGKASIWQPPLIKIGSAKGFAKKALAKETGHKRWTLRQTNLPRHPGVPVMSASFFANPVGPFLMYQQRLPSYSASVNLVKGAWAPKGIKRVKLSPIVAQTR